MAASWQFEGHTIRVLNGFLTVDEASDLLGASVRRSASCPVAGRTSLRDESHEAGALAHPTPSALCPTSAAGSAAAAAAGKEHRDVVDELMPPACEADAAPAASAAPAANVAQPQVVAAMGKASWADVVDEDELPVGEQREVQTSPPPPPQSPGVCPGCSGELKPCRFRQRCDPSRYGGQCVHCHHPQHPRPRWRKGNNRDGDTPSQINDNTEKGVEQPPPPCAPPVGKAVAQHPPLAFVPLVLSFDI